jgi:2-iminobutanoate/2-iminopropanoate deaminase
MAEPRFHVLEEGPERVAPYSHAVEVDGWLFVTGQMPIAPDGSVPQSIEAQTAVVMENLKGVLQGVGAELSQVVSARVFLTDFDAHYERMNKVYASYFREGRFPARTCIGVTRLARGCLVEIDFIARRTKI